MRENHTEPLVGSGYAAESARRCPVCHAVYPADQTFCRKDGAPLERQEETGTLIDELIAGRYLVRARLGAGGMGTVYRAEQIGLERTCAIKVVNREVADDPMVIARFHREALNASRLVHLNIVSTFDFGRTPDGRLFLAMEFVDGEPLSATLEREGPLPPARAVRIARQIAAALAAAEEAGVVHRDLKPDNVMLARARAGGDLVKVVDFGVAKAIHGERQTLTTTGTIVGTLTYMSPEQVAGDRLLDARSDQYALGLIVFEMLTGQRAFPARTLAEATRRLVLEPPRLRGASSQVRWPDTLQAVLDTALAVDPARRHASAVVFADQLADGVARWDGTAETTAPSKMAAERLTSSPTRGRPVARRLGRLEVLVAASASVLLAGGAGLTWAWRRGARLPGAVPPAGAPAGRSAVTATATPAGSPPTGDAPPRDRVGRSVQEPLPPGAQYSRAPATGLVATSPNATSPNEKARPPRTDAPPPVLSNSSGGLPTARAAEPAVPAAPEAPAEGTPSEVRAELARLVEAARRPSMLPGEARATARALVELLPRVTAPAESVQAVYTAAELHYLQLDEALEACRLLRGIARAAVGTTYARAVAGYMRADSPLDCR